LASDPENQDIAAVAAPTDEETPETKAPEIKEAKADGNAGDAKSDEPKPADTKADKKHKKTGKKHKKADKKAAETKPADAPPAAK